MTIDYAERARALVGTRFRPQGRDCHGLDCAGLAIVAFALPPDGFRRDYRLRGNHERELATVLKPNFRRVPSAQRRRGDLMVLEVASDQLHLAVRTDAGFVHADAKLGKVVETPGEPRWPIIAVHRRRASKRGAR